MPTAFKPAQGRAAAGDRGPCGLFLEQESAPGYAFVALWEVLKAEDEYVGWGPPAGRPH